MSIYRDRIFRFITRDIYLPFYCYAPREQVHSGYNYCNCVLDCKYINFRESQSSQDYHGSQRGKGPELQKSKNVPPWPQQK